jgi:hypothetical protein
MALRQLLTTTKDPCFFGPHQEIGEQACYQKLSEENKEVQFQNLLENASSHFIGPNGTTCPALKQLVKILLDHVKGISLLPTKHMGLSRRDVHLIKN